MVVTKDGVKKNIKKHKGVRNLNEVTHKDYIDQLYNPQVTYKIQTSIRSIHHLVFTMEMIKKIFNKSQILIFNLNLRGEKSFLNKALSGNYYIITCIKWSPSGK